MKNINKHIYKLFFVGVGILVLHSCTKNPDSPGVEYTPDMYRSPAIETYVDYGVIRGKEVDSLTHKQSALLPPKGTIPYQENQELAAVMMPYKYMAPFNSDKTHGLFGIPQDADAYFKAAEMKNPIAYSEQVIDEGKRLYENFCIHCHGAEGGGDGTISKNGHIAGIPSFKDKLKDLPEGQIFYSITYGKGLMGSHASLVDKRERWTIAHYIKLLQNGGEYPTNDDVEITEEESEEENPNEENLSTDNP